MAFHRYAFCALLLSVLATAALGTDNATEQRSQLRERMKQRYMTIQGYKKQGVIGETDSGFVGLVHSGRPADSLAKRIIEQENHDRTTLYALIAQSIGLRPEEIGQVNAERILDKADPDHFFQTAEGTWHQKREIVPPQAPARDSQARVETIQSSDGAAVD